MPNILVRGVRISSIQFVRRIYADSLKGQKRQYFCLNVKVHWYLRMVFIVQRIITHTISAICTLNSDRLCILGVPKESCKCKMGSCRDERGKPDTVPRIVQNVYFDQV